MINNTDSISSGKITYFYSFTLSQIFDVFNGRTITLKDSSDFVVSVNPTGVVMWYLSAPAKLNVRQFYKGGKLPRSIYFGDENSLPRVFR